MKNQTCSPLDKRTIAVYDREVGAYKAMLDASPTDSTLLAFMRQVEPGGYVLDLGCGPALASSIMRAQGLRVDPVDASEEMIRLANRTYDIGARQATFLDIDANDVYDGIWANFSLLHASAIDFRTIVTALHSALKAGGLFHLAMKTGAGAGCDRLGRFYTYYSHDELADTLTKAGFDIAEVETGESRGLSGDLSTWIVLRCLAVKEEERRARPDVPGT